MRRGLPGGLAMSRLALASLLLGLAVAADRPSIVFILTDDREREPSIQRTRSTAASSDPDASLSRTYALTW